ELVNVLLVRMRVAQEDLERRQERGRVLHEVVDSWRNHFAGFESYGYGFGSATANVLQLVDLERLVGTAGRVDQFGRLELEGSVDDLEVVADDAEQLAARHLGTINMDAHLAFRRVCAHEGAASGCLIAQNNTAFPAS